MIKSNLLIYNNYGDSRIRRISKRKKMVIVDNFRYRFDYNLVTTDAKKLALSQKGLQRTHNNY